MKSVYQYQGRLFLAAVVCMALVALSPQCALSEEYKPCGISLDSLSVASGAPSEVFEMRGRWGENQGTKIPAINKGGLGRLEVVFWTDKVLTVRIPAGLSHGTYRVGVYCNDMSLGGSYSSGWTNFEVRPSAQSSVVASSPPPSVEKQPDTRESRVVATVAKPTLKERLRLPNVQWLRSGAYSMIMIAAVVLVVAAILIRLLFKHMARPVDPMAEYMAAKRPSPPAAPMSKKTADGLNRLKGARQETPAPIQGSLEGVTYQAECLGHTMPDNIPQMTVWIHLDATPKRRFTVKQSDKAVDVAPDSPQTLGVITTIFMLGAESIDFGHSTNWAAAVMTPGLDVTEALTEQVASKLLELKRLCG